MLTNEEMAELRSLIDRIIYAPTKSAARRDVQRLEFLRCSYKERVNGYLSGKLAEAIGYAKEASGAVKDKEHWISCMEGSWYVFESGIGSQSTDEPDANI